MAQTCPSCGFENRDNAPVCTRCGSSLGPPRRYVELGQLQKKPLVQFGLALLFLSALLTVGGAFAVGMTLLAILVGGVGFLAVLGGASALGRGYRSDVRLALLIGVVLIVVLVALVYQLAVALPVAGSEAEARDAFLGAWPSFVAWTTLVSVLWAVPNYLIVRQILNPKDRAFAWAVMWAHMAAAAVVGVVLVGLGPTVFNSAVGGQLIPSPGFPSPLLGAVPSILWTLVYLQAYREVATERVWQRLADET